MLAHFTDWKCVSLRIDPSEDYEHFCKFSFDLMPRGLNS